MHSRLRLPTLLILTDQTPVRAWLKKHLDSQFFLIEATTREEALLAVQTHSFQLVILDAAFEGADPLALCRELKRFLPQSFLPILLITGRLKKSYRDAALDAGVTDFLNDQLDLEELETRIATAERALHVQKKTADLSATLQQPKQTLSAHYFKNKFLLHDQALRLIAKAKQEQQLLALLLMRVDAFPSLQAQHGYWATQSLMMEISSFLLSFLQETDLLIPSAEGQWIFLLPNQSPEQANEFAERLRKEVQVHPFFIQKESFHLTVSIAITSLEATESAFHQMIEAAIKALKQAQATTNFILFLDRESSS